jgi:hypothetical protein
VRRTAKRAHATAQSGIAEKANTPKTAGAAQPSGPSDRGSAVVEFVMVTVLLALLLFGVLQVAALFYVRSVVASAASDGARYAANAGVEPSAGGPRATELIARGLTDQLAKGFSCLGEQQRDAETGTAIARVRCEGRIRSVFLPLGALITVSASGQSFRERQ